MMEKIVDLNAVYPNPQPIDVLKIRVNVWHEQLKQLSEDMFINSVNLHIKISKFFPTVADILECYQTVVQNTPKPLALDEPHIELTPEEESERKQLIADFKAKKRKIGAI